VLDRDRVGGRLRGSVWGLSGRLIASYILVTFVVVVLVEALVLCFQVLPLANSARLEAQLQDRVDATAKSYAQQLAKRYPGGVPTGTVLGDPGQPARPGQATTTPDGSMLVVPAITGPIHGRQAVTAVVAISADGTVLASSAPSRYPPGRAAASELPAQATGPMIKGGGVPTPDGGVVFTIWPAGRADVYVQAPWTAPGFVSPIRAWKELGLGKADTLLWGNSLLLIAIVPVGVAFGLLASRRLVRRVRLLERATLAVADGDYTLTLPVSGRDEVGRLEANFTSMTRQLGSALEAERQRAGGDARAAERARIARELHDAISQHLFALRMIAAGMRRADPGNQQARAIERISEEALRDMQALLIELRPASLDGAGLARAARDLRRLPGPARRHRRHQPGRRRRPRAGRARAAAHHPGGVRQRGQARQRPAAHRGHDPPGRARGACRPRHRHRLRPQRPAHRHRADPHQGPGRRTRRDRGHRQRTWPRRGAHRPGAGAMTIRVVIADDHRVVRDGLCYLLGQEPDVEVVGEAGDGRQTADVAAATRPDVLLLDLYMPGLDGHAVLAALRDTPHRPAVVVLTSATEDEHLLRAMHAGATSYLLKTAPADDVIAAVRDAAAGTANLSPELLTRLTQALRRPPPPDPLQPLSPRERDVLRLIAHGHSNRQIARDLAIGEQTVKTHVHSILGKLGLRDRVQAAIFALRHGADS
jgi:NarL family two-component system response regulator LiaR